jgi:chemotaxis protein MotB
MKPYAFILLGGLILTSCVPAKKYNELLEREQQCSEDLAKYKADAISYEGKAKEYEAELKVARTSLDRLKADTSEMGNDYRELSAKYHKEIKLRDAMEASYNSLKLRGAKEVAILQKDLEEERIELQAKEDSLIALAKMLNQKEALLKKREARVNELEEIIRKQDAAVAALKAKIAKALKGFEDKGLSVEEKDGKIYVSLEAKLLFASGSTIVEEGGKGALVDLAKVLETEKELEIIVEGHTDTDAMRGTTHPKNNWELSVLRSTAVIEIMTQNSAIDPTILMAAGRSQFHPVDANDKAKNRRIEVIISPNLDELFKVINE